MRAWTRIWKNPLYTRGLAPWRRWWPLLVVLAVLTFVGAIALRSYLGRLLVTSGCSGERLSSIRGVQLWLYVIHWLILSILAVLTAVGFHQERSAPAAWDLLRITPLIGKRLHDAYFIWAFLRFPAWLLLISIFVFYLTTLTIPCSFLALETSDLSLWALLLSKVTSNALFTLIIVAVMIEIGLSSGLASHSPGEATARTFVNLLLLQVILPCIFLISLVPPFLAVVVYFLGALRIPPEWHVSPVFIIFASPAFVATLFGWPLVYQVLLLRLLRNSISLSIDQPADA